MRLGRCGVVFATDVEPEVTDRVAFPAQPRASGPGEDVVASARAAAGAARSARTPPEAGGLGAEFAGRARRCTLQHETPPLSSARRGGWLLLGIDSILSVPITALLVLLVAAWGPPALFAAAVSYTVVALLRHLTDPPQRAAGAAGKGLGHRAPSPARLA